jgi:cytochrome P450
MNEVIEAHYKDFPRSKDINISKEMTSLTWKIVLNALFSVDDKNKDEEWLEGILDVMEAVTARTRSVLPIPFWVPTRKNLKMKKTIEQFNQFVYKLIKERKESTHLPNDLLTLLLGAKDQGDQMNEKQVRDEMITFLMAGHETVANSMTWLMILLSENPEYIGKLQAELKQVDHISNFEEKIQNMPLHRACIDESQRLYPPIWIFMRESIAEDSFNSIDIKKGTNVVVVPYVSHRSAEYWDHPNNFRPERFMEQTKFKPGSYYPFGLGPRACIGFNFATYESVLILSYLVKNFSWKNKKPEKQSFNAGLTLRPTSNTEMKMDRV